MASMNSTKHGLRIEKLALPFTCHGDGPDSVSCTEIAISVEEPGTITWYAFEESNGSYGIFDTFDSEAARTKHICDLSLVNEDGGLRFPHD